MKAWLWGVLALIGLFWTGAVALFARGVEWAVQGLMAAGSASGDLDVAALSIPAWLSPWIDAQTWEALRELLVSVLTGADALWPVLGSVADWLVPAVWVIWGLGLMLLFGVAVVVTVLGRRRL
jgi:hypothetical protein